MACPRSHNQPVCDLGQAISRGFASSAARPHTPSLPTTSSGPRKMPPGLDCCCHLLSCVSALLFQPSFCGDHSKLPAQSWPSPVMVILWLPSVLRRTPKLPGMAPQDTSIPCPLPLQPHPHSPHTPFSAKSDHLCLLFLSLEPLSPLLLCLAHFSPPPSPTNST